MCTVSLTPLKGDKLFVLTSNRDEAPGRETLPPKMYEIEGLKMAFPKDVLAGGTWLGVSERKRVICLLNGEFKKHVRKLPYGKSRGVVVKDLLAAEDFTEAADAYDLSEVEPFTIVAADWQKELFYAEFVWDGSAKHFRRLSLKPHIWSSSPLYSAEMKQVREDWFSELQKQQELTPEALLNFHFSAGKGDKDKGVIMDRGFVKTKSISQITVFEGEVKLYYRDLEGGGETQLDLEI
ncbi:NRDE family protein [Salinimicrobium sediminilitoris]|uniref:NRDE family protein n=1 Tax=Salinimicrobium sediminilitoris TaxID=2876715 RepID=UPI001E2F8524|nr:NRDE family protein [Salinimicrobium sediminilitoris]MCC8358285.1 NRDE family protein [Salinimicrobium sediminilitoris]